VSSPELDALVDVAARVDGVVAARMTGAGFGGCTVNLVRRDAVARLARAVERDYRARTGLTPHVYPVEPVAGAGFVRG
jgi:galactokinase